MLKRHGCKKLTQAMKLLYVAQLSEDDLELCKKCYSLNFATQILLLRLVFDQSSPAHPISESRGRGGSLSVTQEF